MSQSQCGDHPLRPAMDRRLGRPLPHQLANPTRLIHLDKSFRRTYTVLAPVSGLFQRWVDSTRYLTRLPLLLRALDLHVLSLPPAFVLSQDQTLKF